MYMWTLDGSGGSTSTLVHAYCEFMQEFNLIWLFFSSPLLSSPLLSSPLLLLFLSAGAEVLGGGVGSSCRGAEGAGGAAEEERAGAGWEGDWHRGARAEHHHPPDVPGETQREEEEGPTSRRADSWSWAETATASACPLVGGRRSCSTLELKFKSSQLSL